MCSYRNALNHVPPNLNSAVGEAARARTRVIEFPLRAVQPMVRDSEPLVSAAETADSGGATGATASARCERWLVEAAAGNVPAFERFYQESFSLASSIARRIVGSNYVDDVLAEAYIQAWRDVASFDPSRGNAFGWIVTIVRSRALDKLRQEQVRSRCVSDEPTDAIAEEAHPINPETLLESTQTSTALHRALARLSPNERWCLALAYYRDLTHKEIAEFTGLPMGTVKSLIARSQQKLRKTLDEQGKNL